MNWIEIDQYLYTLIRTMDEEHMYKDAMKKFGWDRRQAETAIIPLQNRNNKTAILLEPEGLRLKRLTTRK